MTPHALLIDLEGQGFSLKASGGKLIVSPASRLTADQREAIAANRDALLALVAVPEPAMPVDERQAAIEEYDRLYPPFEPGGGVGLVLLTGPDGWVVGMRGDHLHTLEGMRAERLAKQRRRAAVEAAKRRKASKDEGGLFDGG